MRLRGLQGADEEADAAPLSLECGSWQWGWRQGTADREAVCAKAQRAHGAPRVQGSRKSWVWLCGWGDGSGGGIGRRGILHLTWYQPTYLATLPSCLASLALGLDDFPKLPHAQQRPMLIMASVPIKLGAEQAYGVSPTLAAG